MSTFTQSPRRTEEEDIAAFLSDPGNDVRSGLGDTFSFGALAEKSDVFAYNTMMNMNSAISGENPHGYTSRSAPTYNSLQQDIDPLILAENSNIFLSGEPSNSLAPNASVGYSLTHSSNPYGHIGPGDCASDIDGFEPFTVPTYQPQQLEERLNSSLTLSETTHRIATSNTSYPAGSSYLGMDGTTAQAYGVARDLVPGSWTDSHLLSPSLTSRSSPVSNDSAGNLPLQGSYVTREAFGPPVPHDASYKSDMIHQVGTCDKQQASPALTGSSAEAARELKPTAPPNLTSPIVRVENCSRDESLAPSNMSRTLSKHSHGSHRSDLLSPFPANESTDGEDEVALPQARLAMTAKPSPSVQRNEDGSWRLDNRSGQAGVSPHDREQINNIYVPSIEELEEQRLRAEKNAEVSDWLSRSEIAGESVLHDPAEAVNGKTRHSGRRRAKSANDMNRGGASGTAFGLEVPASNVDHCTIPGPGLVIDEKSDYDEEDEDSDGSEQAPDSPPAKVSTELETQEMSPFPSFTNEDVFDQAFSYTRPWNDPPIALDPTSTKYQPPTSNAAMMKFRQRAKDIESASLTATIGSRRMSESDIGSLFHTGGVSKPIRTSSGTSKMKDKRDRRPGFLDTILPKRANSNLLKRKGALSPPQTHVDEPSTAQKDKDRAPSEKPKRIGSWTRPRSPRIDTNVSTGAKDSLAVSAASSSTPWVYAKNAIRRSRSKSDLGRSFGLAELMTQHGGPPMPTLATPMADGEPQRQSPHLGNADGDDVNEIDEEDSSKGVIVMDLKIRSDPIIPTEEGFRTHARKLNPRLVEYMVERVTQEQLRRYKRLCEFKIKHINSVKNGFCASSTFCVSLGGQPKLLLPRGGSKESEAPFVGFKVTSGDSDDEQGAPDSSLVAAQFPPGVPPPPVKRLPAEFECPLCFTVKKFFKPSDWTKHVHEDVQPFTCTFPNCGEPKSFKRKADWVRHESERHRQLERWTCNIGGCTHTCYRKDNFVQHLVREHKMPEPRARTGRSGNSQSKELSLPDHGSQLHPDGPFPSTNDASEYVWTLVDQCRRETAKQPKDEPCRFCGNVCTSWKKLTVHLAKHMEQLSMPVISLVNSKHLSINTVISPMAESTQRMHSMSTNRLPTDGPAQYDQNLSTSPTDLLNPASHFASPVTPSVNSTAGNTYPPPQLFHYHVQQPTIYDTEPNASAPLAVHSYPGLAVPPKVRRSAHTQQAPARYAPPITPVSAYGQQQMFASPVDSSSMFGDDLFSAHLPLDAQKSSQGGETTEAGIAYGGDGMQADYARHLPFRQVPDYMQSDGF